MKFLKKIQSKIWKKLMKIKLKNKNKIIFYFLIENLIRVVEKVVKIKEEDLVLELKILLKKIDKILIFYQLQMNKNKLKKKNLIKEILKKRKRKKNLKLFILILKKKSINMLLKN